jgi:hypothetical protein
MDIQESSINTLDFSSIKLPTHYDTSLFCFRPSLIIQITNIIRSVMLKSNSWGVPHMILYFATK